MPHNARDEAEVRAIAEHDPGVVDGILVLESFLRHWTIAPSLDEALRCWGRQA